MTVCVCVCVCVNYWRAGLWRVSPGWIFESSADLHIWLLKRRECFNPNTFCNTFLALRMHNASRRMKQPMALNLVVSVLPTWSSQLTATENWWRVETFVGKSEIISLLPLLHRTRTYVRVNRPIRLWKALDGIERLSDCNNKVNNG